MHVTACGVTTGDNCGLLCLEGFMAKTSKKKRLQLSIIVTEEQQAALQALHKATLAPINALVRAAIDAYLESRKAEIRGGK
jgi:Ribbon-helix-helix domain